VSTLGGTVHKAGFLVFVAGPGIEPGSGGSVLPVLSHRHGLSHIP